MKGTASTDRLGDGKVSRHHHSEATSLHGGLKNRAAKFPDRSMGMKGGGSVASDATRSSTAKTPKTLGPRTA
jgi:hypothetical protein